ncbi:MAG: aminopeptidase [Patescibacteria group bacterium]
MRLFSEDLRFGIVRHRALSTLLTIISLTVLNSCYLAHIGSGQLRLTYDSIGLEEALASDDLSDADKDKLRDIQRIRGFAERDLGLGSSDNYTTYYPGPKEPLAYVVTASYRDRLEPATWWFPVVGSVAYKGYFDLGKAKKERDRLAAEGYDVYLRPALAYSTLGWFKDPILPLMLELDESEIAMLVIHELAHGTVFAAGQTEFNESLAEFVGREGAIDFLIRKYSADDLRVAALRDDIADSRRYDDFMRAAALKLGELYASRPADLETARQAFFSGMHSDFLAFRSGFRTEAYRNAELRALNNAVMIGHLAYADTVPFERAFAYADGDWKKFFGLAREAAKSDRPTERLEELTGQ